MKMNMEKDFGFIQKKNFLAQMHKKLRITKGRAIFPRK
jgi:hypothetical protein